MWLKCYQICGLIQKIITEYYIGLKIKKVDEILLKIRPYSEISRYPREISRRAQWKANEWLNWLLYFSPYCLMNILREPYYSHFMKLRNCITLMLGEQLDLDIIKSCEDDINDFVYKYQEFYGEKNMVIIK